MLDGRAILQRTVRLPGCFREYASLNSYPNMLMGGRDVPSLGRKVRYRGHAQNHFVLLKPRIPMELRHTALTPD
jgi:hypothetical protein